MVVNNYNNEIYKLYKLVFNNTYLKSYIYKIVRGINRQIVNSNTSNKSYTQLCRYDNLTFEWMVTNGYFNLINDKLLNQPTLLFNKDEFTFKNLKQFIQQPTTTDEILELFYKIYRDQLASKSYSSVVTEMGLLQFSIYTENSKFIELVHMDDINHNHTELQKQQLKLQGLLETALKIGNLDIIKLLTSSKYNYELNKETSIYFAIMSNNINNVIDYLFGDQVQLKVSEYCKYSESKEFYQCILKLNFSTFQKLFDQIQQNPNPFFDTKITTHQSLINRYCTLIRSYSKHINNKFTTCSFNDFSNFFQIILYILGSFKNKYKQMSRKVNTLIDHKRRFVQDESLISKLISSVNKISSTANTETEYIEMGDKEIEIEVKRIILFGFIKENKSLLVSGDEWTIFVLNFARESGEYGLIESEGLVIKKERSLKLLSSLIISISVEHADPNFMDVIPTFFSNYFTDHLDESYIRHNNEPVSITNNYFNPKVIPTQQQIQFLKSSFKYNLSSKCEILKLVINNLVSPVSLDDLNLIESILVTSSNSTDLNANFIIGNSEIFKYFYKNQKEIFIWDDELIGSNIIVSGNLDLIQFIHDENIGKLDIDLSIYHSKNRQVAEHLYALGYKFTHGNLVEISGLPQRESGYLFKYSLLKLSALLKAKTTSGVNNDLKITLSPSIIQDYNKLKYIQQFQEYIEIERFYYGNNQFTLEYINGLLDDQDFVINTGNLKYINQFTREKLITKDQHFYSTTLSNNSTFKISTQQNEINAEKKLTFIKNYYKNK